MCVIATAHSQIYAQSCQKICMIFTNVSNPFMELGHKPLYFHYEIVQNKTAN